MSSTVPPRSAQPLLKQGTGTTLAVLLAAWFVLVILLGAKGEFISPTGTPPLPIAMGFAAPLILFFASLWLSRSFHEFVLTLDLRLMVGIQAWRFAGLGFLALYTHNVLPGSFAWPAGLGDIAIAVTAPWLLVTLIRRPNFAASPTFIVWNTLGIVDQCVSVGSGALSSVLATGAPGEITTTPMAQLPLVLIPAFLVPIFIMLHVASLMQARRVARDLKASRSDDLEVTHLPGHPST
jgi:hypothetical protein